MSHPVGIDLTPNQRHILRHPVPHRGAARDRHERGAGCGGRGCVARRAALTRTAKSCGPDTPTLVSSSCGAIRGSDGGKKARSPRRARRKPLKPLRREGRIASAEPVCSCAFSLLRICTRDRGCSAHPVFPAPSVFSRAGPNTTRALFVPRECFCCLKCESHHVVPALRRDP